MAGYWVCEEAEIGLLFSEDINQIFVLRWFN